MSAVSFVRALLERGVVRVPGLGQTPDDWLVAVEMLDIALRPEMPFDPPPLDRPAAIWGLRMFWHGCQFLANREVDGERVMRVLSEPCPKRPAAAVCYSVDLALRFCVFDIGDAGAGRVD